MWYRDFVFIFAWFESFITSSHQCYFISKTLHTALWLYNNTKNNFWFSSERFLLNFLYHYCFPESSKTPSWIRTSNRQYLLPKHEMLYSNVSPKTKNFRENNRIKMFPRFLKTNKNLALYTLCPKFFHLYFVMYILYRVILFTI